MVAWGPIIGAGISALGSIFGGSDDDETTTRVNYKQMANDAMEAGFNPLTAIRNGGSAGFTTTTHPALSGAAFGSAFQTLGNALMSFDARADERAGLENQILEAQLQGLNRTNAAASMNFFGDVPQAAGSTQVGPGNRPLAPNIPKAELGTRGNPAPLYNYVVDPDDPDKRVIKIPNINFVPDDPSGLAVGGLAEGGQTIEDALNWLRPRPNNKPQGNPPTAALPGLPTSRGPSLGSAVDALKDYTAPWKGEWFYPW